MVDDVYDWQVCLKLSGVVYKIETTTTKTVLVPEMSPVEHQTWEEKKRKQNYWQQHTDFCPEDYDRNQWSAVERMSKTVSRRERRSCWSIVSNAIESPVTAFVRGVS